MNAGIVAAHQTAITNTLKEGNHLQRGRCQPEGLRLMSHNLCSSSAAEKPIDQLARSGIQVHQQQHANCSKMRALFTAPMAHGVHSLVAAAPAAAADRDVGPSCAWPSWWPDWQCAKHVVAKADAVAAGAVVLCSVSPRVYPRWY